MTRRENLDPDLVVRARSGDRKAMEVLVDRMTPIVSGRAWRMVQGSHHEFDDCFQAGMEAVLACVHTYDPKKGSFETWAFLPMRRAIAQNLSDSAVGPSVPHRTRERYLRALSEAEGDLTRAEIVASDLGLPRATFQAVHEAVSGTVSPHSFTLPGPSEARFELEDLSDLEEQAVTRLLVEGLLDLLTSEIDRDIVSWWVGLDGDPMTDSQIASRLGLARVSVTHRRLKALAKMRKGSHE